MAKRIITRSFGPIAGGDPSVRNYTWVLPATVKRITGYRFYARENRDPKISKLFTNELGSVSLFFNNHTNVVKDVLWCVQPYFFGYKPKNCLSLGSAFAPCLLQATERELQVCWTDRLQTGQLRDLVGSAVNQDDYIIDLTIALEVEV